RPVVPSGVRTPYSFLSLGVVHLALLSAAATGSSPSSQRPVSPRFCKLVYHTVDGLSRRHLLERPADDLLDAAPAPLRPRRGELPLSTCFARRTYRALQRFGFVGGQASPARLPSRVGGAEQPRRGAIAAARQHDLAEPAQCTCHVVSLVELAPDGEAVPV